MKLLNKFILPVLLIAVIILIIRHSTRNSSENKSTAENRLEYTLQLAGTNRVELEKVLTHFENDSLKHEAALFLIENMADCREEKWQCYRNGQPDSTFSLRSFKNQYDARPYMDSLNIGYRQVATITDCSVISSGFLIEHIERAFGLWQRPDNQYLSFDDFKETLLPYRTATEKLENNYQYIATKYDTLFKATYPDKKLEATVHINNQLKKEIKWNSRMLLYPGSLSCIEMDSLKSGHCEHLVNYGLKVFRTAGIAMGNDFVPAWGNEDAGHAWNVLYLKNKKIPFAACGDNPLEFPFYWRAPKIFRCTYQFQNGGIWAYKNKHQEVPVELSDQHHIDVTSQYYKTITLNIPLKHKPPKNDNCAFLCVYNNNGWRPVDWGKINRKKNTALFSNVNDSLLYCVMYYNWMRLKPATLPFWVASADSIHFLEPNENNVTLTRIFDYNYFQWNTTQPDREYELMIWENEWKPVGKAFAYPCYRKGNEWIKFENTDTIIEKKVKYFIDFNNIPANGLYWLTADERPFWMVNGKMIRRFPCKAYIHKKLIK